MEVNARRVARLPECQPSGTLDISAIGRVHESAHWFQRAGSRTRIQPKRKPADAGIPRKEAKMAEQQFVVVAPIARRAPDPVFSESHGIMRHILFVPVRSIPKGMPLDPNARQPNINRRIYRDIDKSLLNGGESQQNAFHLRHKGVTIVATKVEEVREPKNGYRITFADGEGILDGGHTYDLIVSHEPRDLPERQFVKLEILTRIPPEWIVELAGGLNTTVQVQAMSLDDLGRKFDWIKDELKDEPYAGKIAWRENQAGEFDARDLVAFLTCFNILSYPNGGDQHPVAAFSSKAKCLEAFEKEPEKYKRLRPILKDILTLHDIICYDTRAAWNKAGGKFGKLSFVEEPKRGKFQRFFADGEADYRLLDGALYPMLAAFRWMVEEDPQTNEIQWKGGFNKVRERWEASVEELMRLVYATSLDVRGNPNALGKSASLWANLHGRVAMRDLMAKSHVSA
jgi:hypothetical protein